MEVKMNYKKCSNCGEIKEEELFRKKWIEN